MYKKKNKKQNSIGRAFKNPSNFVYLKSVSRWTQPCHSSSIRSMNCPWTSPQTVMGHRTHCTFSSLIKTSRALAHSCNTCCSEMGSHLYSFSIQPSMSFIVTVELVAGKAAFAALVSGLLLSMTAGTAWLGCVTGAGFVLLVYVTS